MFDVSYNGQFFSPSRAAQPKTQNPGRGAAQNPKPGPLCGPKPKTQNRRRGLIPGFQALTCDNLIRMGLEEFPTKTLSACIFT